jgi:hypothetical protein
LHAEKAGRPSDQDKFVVIHSESALNSRTTLRPVTMTSGCMGD